MKVACLLSLLVVVVAANVSAETINVHISYEQLSQEANFDVNPDADTVLELKEKIKAKLNVPLADQQLIHDNDIFRDELVLAKYHLKNNADILLFVVPHEQPKGRLARSVPEPEEVTIFLRHSHSDKVFTMKVNLDTTVLSVKQKIEQEEGIAVERQNIIHGNDMFHNDKTLEDYKVKDQMELFLLDLPSWRSEQQQEQ